MDHDPDRYANAEAAMCITLADTSCRLNVHLDNDGIVKDVKMG